MTATVPRVVAAVRERRRGRRGAPVALLLPAACGLALLVLPLVGLVARAPWSTLPRRLAEPDVLAALRLSVQTATVATVVCLVLGVPLAWLLARVDFPGRRLVRALVTVPLVLPPVVGGVALLLVFGRRGLVGSWLDATFGVTLPFTTAGVVLAQVFVAMPFLVLAVEGRCAVPTSATRRPPPPWAPPAGPPSPTSPFPLVAPGVAAGAVLCWARALGEFGATITFAGNFPGRTQTMPLAVYLALETDPQAAIVLSLLLLAVSVAVLAALRDRWLAGS